MTTATHSKIAVVGSGISGLACAWRLAEAGQDVTLYEAGDYAGGHTHTVDVTLDGHTCGVDTGFLVFNHRTYPNLVRLFDILQVDTAATDMSFSVKLPLPGCAGELEWAGDNLDTVFAQRRNLLRPAFLRMLRDILRFNCQATALAQSLAPDCATVSLGDFLAARGYSAPFIDWYLLPMAACIWSCPTEQMLAFPLSTFVRFCHNHGLLQINDRPQWHTVRGGARQYVRKMLAAIPDLRLNTPVLSVARAAGQPGGVEIHTRDGVQSYDHVVLAAHSDQSLALLADASTDEAALLGAIKYQVNTAVLHTDVSCLPRRRKLWAAWNYQSAGGNDADVCVHYLINRLQPLPFATPMIVSLNPIAAPHPSQVIDSFTYAHPVFDSAAIAAQSRLETIQGRRNTWFAGAWTGFGFHEDGLKSGLAAAEAILQSVSVSASAPMAA